MPKKHDSLIDIPESISLLGEEDKHTWSWNQIRTGLLFDLRRQSRAQTAELQRQTKIFARIDERLKRGGFSLGKSNRK